MTAQDAKPEPRTQVDCGEEEPPAIIFLGGPKHGRRIADMGWHEVHEDDEIYRRQLICLRRGETEISKAFLVYFGKHWENAVRKGR